MALDISSMAPTSSNSSVLSSNEAESLLQTLHKSDYESDRRRIPSWTPNSCDWFLQEPLYQSWKGEQKSSFLWLSGPEGCGKSVLASFLIKELGEEDSQKKLPGTVCYFFFNANSKENKNPCTALCAILHQLFESKIQNAQHTQLIEHALSDFHAQGHAITEQVTTLWRIVKSVTADPKCGKNVICVIDGLSECEEASQVPFINAIARLYSERETQETKGALLKIIATTRIRLEPSSDGIRRLKQTTMKSITLSPNKAHLLYVRARVGKIGLMKGFSESAQARLISVLTTAADGTFLFLSLFLDLLEDFAVNDENALQWLDLSKSANNLANIYRRSLSRSSDLSSTTTSTLLSILCGAAEPLTLKEINVAIGVRYSAEANDQHPADITAKILKSHCGILLRVVDSKVVFVHQTAREFLMKADQAEAVNSEQWNYSVNLVDSNKLLAEICVSYLLKLDLGKNSLDMSLDGGDLLFEQNIKDYTDKYPFLEYAAKHWAEHFSFSTAKRLDQPLVDSVIKLCNPSSEAFRTWFQMYWTCAYPPSSPPKSITAVMVDCHFGHTSVLDQRLKKSTIDTIGIKQADERGYTALHWAAQSGKPEIVELILKHDPDLNAKTKEKRTALDLAAGRGHEKVVQLILSRILTRTDQNKPSTLTNTSVVQKETVQSWRKSLNTFGIARTLMLIGAAQGGNEALVNNLLDQGTNSNQANDDGSTALHLAASNNHTSIVRLLLEKGRADIDRRNANGETALALASTKGYKAVVEFLLSRGANRGGENFDGNTLFNRADASVRELLKHPPIVRGPSVIPRARSPPPFIPFARQVKEESHPSHFFRATVLDLWFQDSRTETTADTREENFHEERSQFANPTVHDLLYGKGPNSIMSPLQGYVPKTSTFRWLHLPANNLMWVKHLVNRIYDERIAKPGKLRAAHFEAKLKKVDRLFDAGQQYRAPKDAAVHSRFFRPSCRGVNNGESSTVHSRFPPDSKQPRGRRPEGKPLNDESAKDDTASKENDIVLFMPFLHYETNAGRKSIARAIDSATESRDGLEEGENSANEKERSPDEKLIHTYLHQKPYMHIRRTLDQYYYHTMKDTTERDEDQVVYRYAKKMWPDDHESVHNILMVDQLWLWILDGGKLFDCSRLMKPSKTPSTDTVITSFPQRWNRRQFDNDLDVVESIRKHINLVEGRDPLRSAYDLAVLISSFCSEVFFEREDAPEPLDEKLQILEFFDKSIGNVTADETECFNRLAKFFKELDSKTRENEGNFIEAMKKEDDDHESEGQTNLNTDKPYDVFYHIGDEAALLREIKDIRDELNIITKVFMDQQKALEAMHKLVSSKVSFKGKTPSSEIIRRIKRHMNDIKEIDDHASRTYEALNHLLDLKQKHANVCEARWTREQAQQTAKQSNTIMVFTIVTIIFLPLSFMAAFFALQIVQFPKDPKTGALALELNYVARYLFGISAAIIVPFIVIAFNVNRLNRNIRERFGQFITTRFGTWVALKILKGLGRLKEERKESLIRRRDNRIRNKRARHDEERSPPHDPSPTPDPRATEKISNGAVHKENITEKDRPDGANGPVYTRSFDQAFRRLNRLPATDEENRGSPMRPGRTKAKTFPIRRGSGDNRLDKASR
ncbi:hypothetical protein MMC29_004228 [Sticta canariensis]|nr:hypothetical protein [Sticta canariensis]